MKVRFFAGAMEAAGTEETEVVAEGMSAAEVVESLGRGNPRLAEVLRVSSLLADGVRVNDLALDLTGVAQLDVLPPFAGG
ncbi:MoaD/ThiS family protein [Arachnia propionica]|uniref:MoaD/ThiS family protein n=1 Tax=Arachnia propionica TaxID=1750 RepID=A0A3P1T2J4_9ACTN|nr:MoaD/ThiS family protein [Arachnia propionica]MDO5082306.1 MoaD/ThiS family protein [Arachnia propionica]RRD03478.1 MoaD/ThiS family protein [Arachnia propionica]